MKWYNGRVKYLLGVAAALSMVGVGIPARTVFIAPAKASAALTPPSAPVVTPAAQIAPQRLISPSSSLYRVAACESTGNPNGIPRQFNNDGSILWGISPATLLPVKRDCGEFQINTQAHGADLKKLGLDVCNSQADNEAYALILYRKNGLKDWSASQGCWEN